MGETGSGGSADAQAELAGRLRKAMTGRGLTQKDLAARAGLSVGAVSKILEGKIVPHLDTLDRIAAALSITGQARTDLYRLRGRADRRGRRLDGYLHAALSAARSHPYSGGLTGTAPPLLKDVHLGQRAVLRSTSDSPRGAPRSLPAEKALSGGQMCLIAVQGDTQNPGQALKEVLEARRSAALRGFPTPGRGALPRRRPA